ERSLLSENCSLTRKESELLIIATSLRHHIPDVGLDNIIQLIDCHLSSTVYKSKYKFLQPLPDYEFQEYYYCCKRILNFDSNNVAFCRKCQTRLLKSTLKDENKFFIYIPIEQQLEELINSSVYNNLRKECDESDVLNGDVYKRLRRKNVIQNNDISLQWNVDGVSLCKSSKKKLIHLQKEGLSCTTFLSKQKITIKVHTLFCTVDSVARPLVQCMKQFNGEYGCPFCMHNGEQVEVGRGTTRVYPWVFKEDRTNVKHMEYVEHALRLHKSYKGVKGPSIVSLLPYGNIINDYPPDYMHSCLLGVGKLFASAWFDSKNNQQKYYMGLKANEFNSRLLNIKPPNEITRTPTSHALRLHKSYKGVKGPSIVSLLPYGNIINDYPPDYMHSCLLGVGKLFASAWFDSKNNQQKYYMGLKANEFNSRILNIKPQNEITRTPTSVYDKYNANDWKNFILYYSTPCLDVLLDKKYLKHWYLFVYSLYMFSNPKISGHDFELGKNFLLKFVRQVEPLYHYRPL
ncbi:hypothetical protein TSAR_007171, partial [Trichomalopsis sarcophagae]